MSDGKSCAVRYVKEEMMRVKTGQAGIDVNDSSSTVDRTLEQGIGLWNRTPVGPAGNYLLITV